jgi:hypothetical protein
LFSASRLRRLRARGLAVVALIAALSLLPIAPASAGGGSGGISGSGDGSRAGGSCKQNAKLDHGLAKAPDCAPRAVRRVIHAANDIAKGKGYCMGGGHGDWKSSCYDCSGSVSYALHGGGLLNRPRDSSGLAQWGKDGKGSWITVFGNSGHAYMKVAGLRFDTSMTAGAGPGWSDEMRSARGYTKRHKKRF